MQQLSQLHKIKKISDYKTIAYADYLPLDYRMPKNAVDCTYRTE